MPRSIKASLTFRFPTRSLREFFMTSTPATCPIHLIFFLFDHLNFYEYKSRSWSLFNFLKTPVTFLPLRPNSLARGTGECCRPLGGRVQEASKLMAK